MPAFTTAHLNFGYPWWLSYGHLPIVAVRVPRYCSLDIARKWSKWPMLVVGAVALWSSAAFVVARFGLDINGRASLPTQSFLPFRHGTCPRYRSGHR